MGGLGVLCENERGLSLSCGIRLMLLVHCPPRTEDMIGRPYNFLNSALEQPSIRSCACAYILSF